MACLCIAGLQAQTTFPVNGLADPRTGTYAFVHATVYKDGIHAVTDATLLIREGKIVLVGTGIAVPKDAVVVDCKGRSIYPSFIDTYSDYGITAPQRQAAGFDYRAPAQLTSSTKGAIGWNQAIKPETDGAALFAVDEEKAKLLRESGFGTVATHQKDGIARGTGPVVTLAEEKENLVIVKEKAAAFYSFSKGSSTQSYPSSMMGCIALLRQTFLDAAWYRTNPQREGLNLSLQAWNANSSLPQVFDVLERTGADLSTKWNAVRADRIGDEFGVQFIIKASGYEYQRMPEMAATKAAFILPLNFPQAMDVEDPADARFVSLSDMKHWELAPTQPAAFQKAGITFCLTADGLRDSRQFFTQLRKAVEYGLSEEKAMEALTRIPATLLNVYDKTGSIEAGKIANFLITNGPLFREKTSILENWVQGKRYVVKDDAAEEHKGIYSLSVNFPQGTQAYTLEVKSAAAASVIAKDTLTTRFSLEDKMVRIDFSPVPPQRRRPAGMDSARSTRVAGNRSGFAATPAASIRLSGITNGTSWQGIGSDTLGNSLTWTATFVQAGAAKPDSGRSRPQPVLGNITYPFNGYGWDSASRPRQETILIRNATVWTSEKEGRLNNTDVLVRNGKIVAVGKNLSAAGARIIDGTGKHLSPGIIDEHSHIAASSINEGAQSVTSEVRIGDNLNPDDINIYRQLSGGVTTSHILHGSANSIGGQTQLIKLRWGANDEELKFKGADPFIKFALGENVKRTTSQNNNRFPDTRMGVEEVFADAFQRASDYEKALKADPKNTRRDLELDALIEILNNKRFITCHSYVQSEITALMRVADRYRFRVNTFTHILEGYKVADKMKAHQANASTFSDWWYYKMEVQDAIAYNAALMHKTGLNVAINSDDAEMARRLNQEAAKTVKYGGLTEEEALRLVTINPATMLHVQDRTGSIKTGKDADLVLWSDNPLSIYAKALYTIVDGIVYFDREKDLQLRKQISQERNRLIRKLMSEKRNGAMVSPPAPSMQIMNTCNDHSHQHGILIVDGDETDGSSR